MAQRAGDDGQTTASMGYAAKVSRYGRRWNRPSRIGQAYCTCLISPARPEVPIKPSRERSDFSGAGRGAWQLAPVSVPR